MALPFLSSLPLCGSRGVEFRLSCLWKVGGYPSIPSWLIQTAVLGCQVDLMSPRGGDFSRS